MSEGLATDSRLGRRGAVVVPAHDEEAVILRTLTPLADLPGQGVEVVVVANGCTDQTAARARSLGDITVLELGVPSKVAALNAADEVASGWPRLYLDADITLTVATVRAVLARLDAGGVLAARPSFRYVTEGCAPAVRAYYRARARIPGMTEHLWGAGVYGLSAEGHARLGRFPDLVADDLYVDQLFGSAEKAVVPTEPVLVQCPRTVRALVHTLRRVYRGRSQVARTLPVAAVGGVAPLLRSVRGPRQLLDAVVYVGLVLQARTTARVAGTGWQRDSTSRIAPRARSETAPEAAAGAAR